VRRRNGVAFVAASGVCGLEHRSRRFGEASTRRGVDDALHGVHRIFPRRRVDDALHRRATRRALD
jgi:hypothetical protein